MTFHRKSAPTYFIAGGGSLLAGYDRINTPSDPSVGGSGSPAPANGKKAGGPNDGTYFVAFGEDGVSAAFNRPASALGDNTDALDDAVRTSVPVPKPLDQATGGSPLATVAITDEVFVGKNATADNQANRDKIVRITDQNNNDLEVSGVKVVATLIHDGANNSVVGTRADGFRTNASVTFTPSIPASTSYRVWYGTRNSWANIALVDKSSLFGEQLRTINNISGEVRSLFRQLHSEPSVNQAFDAAWDSTIRSLASSGLNERYRRATTQPSGFSTGQFNVAGAGGTILRDGPAVTITSRSQPLSDSTMIDPDLATLKITPQELRGINGGVPLVATLGGDFGYWHESEFRSYPALSGGEERNRSNSAGPAVIEVIPRDIRASTASGHAVLTRISPIVVDATLNPDSVNDTDNKRTIQCGTGNFFATGSPFRTAMRLGIDLIEVVKVSDGSSSIFVVENISSTTRIRVVRLNGSFPNFGATATTGLKLYWLQPITKIGGGLNWDLGNGSGFWSRPLLSIPPSNLTDTASAEFEAPPAFFGAQTGSVVDALGGFTRARALEWGATASPDNSNDVAGNVFVSGFLTGDGGAAMTHLSLSDFFVGVTGTFSSDLTALRVNKTKPERNIIVEEDFLFGFADTTQDILYSDYTWSAQDTGSPAVSFIGGTAKNPGRLKVAFGNTGGTNAYQFQFGAVGATPFTFANVDQLDFVIFVNDDAANATTSVRVGLVKDNSLFNGGTDCLTLFYAKADPTHWRLLSRIATVPTVTVLGALASSTFVVVRFKKTATGMDIIFNDGAPLSIATASLPSGPCTYGFQAFNSVADPNAFEVQVDFLGIRASTGARQGA